MSEQETRICHTCKKTFPLTSKFFYSRSSRPSYHKGYQIQCKSCVTKIARKYKCKEHGYMIQLSHGVLGRQKLTNYQGTTRIYRPLQHELDTREKVLKHWEEYKQKYGYTCFYTGIKMTHINLVQSSTNKKQISTNISIDRIDSDIGYTKQNTVFCSWGFNKKKGAITVNMCETILKKAKERGIS